MKRCKGRACLVIGTAFLMAAALLAVYNMRLNQNAGEQSQNVLEQITDTRAVEAAKSKTDTVNIDGYNYIGTLSIPSLSLTLPVMDKCDEQRLKIAPCRDCNFDSNGSLVIAAHNYKKHFGRLGSLAEGALVTFTDVNNKKAEFCVAKIETIESHEVDKIQTEEYPLILYTCNFSGRARIVAFCTKTGLSS